MRIYFSNIGGYVEVEFVLRSKDKDRDGCIYSQIFRHTTEGIANETKEEIVCRGMMEGFKYLSRALKLQLDSDVICEMHPNLGHIQRPLGTWWIE